MTKLLAQFKFDSADFDIIQQTKNGLSLKIYRELVCDSTTGVNRGLSTKISVHDNTNTHADLVWELRNQTSVLSQGYTSDSDIPVPLGAGSYHLKIYAPDTGKIVKTRKPRNIDNNTHNKLLCLQVRNYLLNALSKALPVPHNIRFPSEHLDDSGNNHKYRRSIRVEIVEGVLHHVYIDTTTRPNIQVITYNVLTEDSDTHEITIADDLIDLSSVSELVVDHVLEASEYTSRGNQT